MTEQILTFREILAAVPSEGMVLEFGVASGRSLNQIADAIAPRIAYGFDWFLGLPERWHTHEKGAFSTGGRLPTVRSNAKIVLGRVEDTLDLFLADHSGPVAFAHFDMDLYAPTAYALRMITGRCRVGTVLLFDEWPTEAGGLEHEQKAFAEFLLATGYRAEFIGKRAWHAWAFRLGERTKA